MLYIILYLWRFQIYCYRVGKIEFQNVWLHFGLFIYCNGVEIMLVSVTFWLIINSIYKYENSNCMVTVLK